MEVVDDAADSISDACDTAMADNTLTTLFTAAAAATDADPEAATPVVALAAAAVTGLDAKPLESLPAATVTVLFVGCDAAVRLAEPLSVLSAAVVAQPVAAF